MEMNRRDFGVALAALAAVGLAVEGSAAEAQGDGGMTASRVFRYEEMPVTKNANGGWGREVFHGVLATGEYVAVHESMLPPGKMPHAPHKHRNSEIICVREGKLEFLNDGKVDPKPVGPGDIIFVASEVMHGWTNVGKTDALYFVVEISRKEIVGVA